MNENPPRTFGEDFKRFFLRGLVILLPSVLTLWIVVKAYQFIDNAIAEPINRGVRQVIYQSSSVYEPVRMKFDPLEDELDLEMQKRPPSQRTPGDREQVRMQLRAQNITDWWRSRPYMDLIGLGIAIIAVYVAGRLLGGFFGRRVYRRLEAAIMTLPVVRQVYPHVKQIVDFLFSDERPIKFNRVVVVQYPRKGIWSLGFHTGSSLRAIGEKAGMDAITVFIPSSPTPFTGYTITVPREDVLEVAVSVDEALRFTVSGGVLVPPSQEILEDSPQRMHDPRALAGAPELPPAAPGEPAEPASRTGMR